jgi:hypothetical protein
LLTNAAACTGEMRNDTKFWLENLKEGNLFEEWILEKQCGKM